MVGRTLLLGVTLAGLIFGPVHAGTTIESTSQCQYIDADGLLKVSGVCKLNWGVGMELDGDTPTRYTRIILELPDGKSSVVFYDVSDSEGQAIGATANDVPAQIIYGPNRTVVLTEEGEVFVFGYGGERP